ncbi:hypothetical protein, partial [Sediminispirochaeta bajacaliforniensis]|uniref:hypothetical protein n=1 Tax=Sediminispirochaeta bajacaliforniensis TaxID=148 RepID=UPI00036309C4
MTHIQKIALSLLLTILLTTAFAFVAYSGFFSFIEARYFDVRVTDSVNRELTFKRSEIASYHKENVDRFRTVLSDFDAGALYAPNWDQETIFSIRNLIDTFRDSYRGVVGIRFVDNQRRVHFSTFDDDVERSGRYKTIFRDLPASESTGLLLSSQPSSGDSDGDESSDTEVELRFLPDSKEFRYSLPVTDVDGRMRGNAFWYVSVRDLERFLIRAGALDPSEILRIVAGGYLFDAFPDSDGNGTWSDEFSWSEAGNRDREVWSDGAGKGFYLFTTPSDGFGRVGFFVDTAEFRLQPSLKIVLVLATFFSLFLLFFLFFNLRQDKVLVLSERVRRFQIQFLREYLERKDELDWNRWHRDVENRKDEVKKGIRAGLGKLKPEDEEEVDRLIESGWNEIFSVIDRHIADRAPALPGKVDISNLEAVVGKILELGAASGRIDSAALAPSGAPKRAAERGTAGEAASSRSSAPVSHTADSDGLAAEPEDAGVEAPDEVEELAELEEPEALEEAEELEEVGELEAAEEPEEIE